MIKIESGITIPLAHKGPVKGKTKYNLDFLKIGDSFFLPNRSAFPTTTYGKRFNIVLTRRAWEENGIKGIRIWRVK